MTLIIDLNTNLRIFKSQTDLELIYTKDKTNGALDLTEKFQDIFTSLPEANQYHLFIGESAGFMDSRVIFIWLSNDQLFRKSEFFVNRVNFNPDKHQELIQNSIANNHKDLAYSREPNIGVKK
jgi:hypothetical protein